MLHQAIKNIKVVDLTRVMAGPWCTQNLADLGAEVIKIEHPIRGDDTRGWGPPYFESDKSDEKMSAYFMTCNRGKKSVSVDFSTPEGAEFIRSLLLEADVFVENFKAGSLKKYGLDPESVRALNPRLVHVSITAFGQSGPLSAKPGYDYMFQGIGGLMSFTGQPDGAPGEGPLRTAIPIVDLMTGMYATSAVLAALYQRTTTQLGCHIDLCLLDAAVALNANQAANFLVSKKNPVRSGNTHPNCAPYEVFECSDGHLILAVGNDSQFKNLCVAFDCPEWSDDPRFQTNSQRLVNMDILRPRIREIFSRHDKQYWTSLLDKTGVPWGPINTLEDVFTHPQVVHRELLHNAEHPVLGNIPLVRNPMLAGTPNHLLGAAPPLLGEHTASVLANQALQKNNQE